MLAIPLCVTKDRSRRPARQATAADASTTRLRRADSVNAAASVVVADDLLWRPAVGNLQGRHVGRQPRSHTRLLPSFIAADVVVEFELPPKQVVPDVRGCRYVKTRDVIEPLPRTQNEIRQRYKRLIACVALRTLYEIFTATPPEVVEAVVLNGRLSTIDRTTGKPARPHLLSVSAERPLFEDLVLAAVEPAACLTRLNALVSPNPYDLEAVEPFIAFDLKRFRFTDDLDVVAGLDSRPNLLNLTPTEFEHLVKQLFVAMGAEAWTTIPSKDGGVDAVATSKHLRGRPRCGCGPGYAAPSPGRRRSSSRRSLCVDPVKRGIQVIEADSTAPGGLLSEVIGQRRPILKVREVIDVDKRDDRLAVLADGDGTVGIPRLRDKFTQMRPGRGQRIGSHASKLTLCSVLRPTPTRRSCQ